MQSKQKYSILTYNSDNVLETTGKYIVSNTIERAAKKAYRQSKKSLEIVLMDSSGEVYHFNTANFSFHNKEALIRKKSQKSEFLKEDDDLI